MKKGKLTTGQSCIYYRAEIIVTLRTFTTALADYFYGQSDISEIDKLTKARAEKILKNQIRLFGRQGEHPPGFFESTDEVGEEYNRTWDIAHEWVLSKYPDLKED